MAVKLRLQRKGRKKAPFYHIVVADGRSPRDGRFIEKIGTYNPLTVPATIELNRDKAFEWLMKGAQPTDTVSAILRFKGVLLRKHLAGGVAKGALTQEQADAKMAQWIEEKDSNIAKRRAATVDAKAKKVIAVDGTPKVKVKPVAPVEEAAPVEAAEEAAHEEAAAPAHVEAAPEVVAEAPAAPAEEAAPVHVEAAPEVVAEAPAAPAEEAAPVHVEAAPEVVAEAPAAPAEEAAPEAPAAEEKTEEA
jgi:small subunit ribosomal protein S16